MSGLGIAWGIALIVTIGALPAGIWRTLAYRSGHIEADHTPTMRIAAVFALTLGLFGLMSLMVLSVLLLA
jgi:hypothetical protein